ncbi:MAG TPA: FtsX-like permease family protein [Acidimicrobiales bacterium]|nr:FtsX-like permease family protein [Acidimicrobiales bacterium]
MPARGLSDAWRLARLRERAAPSRSSLVALAVVIALLVGLSLGSLAMARRTASSFTTFLATTHPSTLLIEPAGGSALERPGEAARLAAAVARYPGVTRAEAAEGVGAQLLSQGRPVASALDRRVIVVASVNGLYLDMDRVTLTAGRMPNPRRADEVVVTPTAATALHVGVGSTLRVAVNDGATRVDLRVVGEGVLARSIIQDDVARYPTYVIGTPALAAEVTRTALIYVGARLRDGGAGVAAVEHRWSTSERFFTDYRLTSQSVAAANQTLRPLALALDTFGVIAGAVTLLLAAQALSRRSAGRRRDREVLRALGASATDLVVDGLPTSLLAVALGALGAGIVAVALSPVGPLGPVRPYAAHRGLSFDPLVVGAGVGALVALLVLVAVVVSVRHAPPRVDRSAASRARRPVVAAAVARSGAPVSAATGTRFALEGGRGRGAPSRWTIVGSVVALAVLGATLTFGDSLDALVSHPALYGWNWDVAVESSQGYGPVPQGAIGPTPRGVATSGLSYVTLFIDGVEVPTLLANARAAVAPPIVSGHALDGRSQVVLGASTMATLGVHLGSEVSVVFVPGFPKRPLRLRVVGAATMPAIGISEGLHTSLGVGAIVDAFADGMTIALGPKGYGGNCNGPNVVLVRAPSARAARAAAAGIATRANAILGAEPATSICGGNYASVLGVLRPAPIVNYRSMGATPVLLASALALGALSALAATLVSGVARRRRELAVLKSLGLTQRQLVAAVAWQSAIVAGVGALVGLPLGVVAGRWLWDLFARAIGVVPSPAVPVVGIVLVGFGALALALAAALPPGRRAARIPAAEALRSE